MSGYDARSQAQMEESYKEQNLNRVIVLAYKSRVRTTELQLSISLTVWTFGCGVEFKRQTSKLFKNACWRPLSSSLPYNHLELINIFIQTVLWL